jgi:hypothetical protein
VIRKKNEKKTMPAALAACPACFLVVAPAAARVPTATGTYHRECYQARGGRPGTSGQRS